MEPPWARFLPSAREWAAFIRATLREYDTDGLFSNNLGGSIVAGGARIEATFPSRQEMIDRIREALRWPGLDWSGRIDETRISQSTIRDTFATFFALDAMAAFYQNVQSAWASAQRGESYIRDPRSERSRYTRVAAAASEAYDNYWSTLDASLKADMGLISAGICANCAARCTLICSGCMETAYCNTRCQRMQWSIHEAQCSLPKWK